MACASSFASVWPSSASSCLAWIPWQGGVLPTPAGRGRWHKRSSHPEARRPGRLSVAVVLLGTLAAVIVALWAAAVPLPVAWVQSRCKRVGVGSTAVGCPARGASVVPRRFFQNTWIDPEYWKKRYFVCETLDALLPKGKPKQEMIVVELEPTDGRYLAYLKVSNTTSPDAWYLGKVFYIGTTLWGADKDRQEKLKNEALAVGAVHRFEGWKSPTKRWDLIFLQAALIRVVPRVADASNCIVPQQKTRLFETGNTFARAAAL